MEFEASPTSGSVPRALRAVKVLSGAALVSLLVACVSNPPNAAGVASVDVDPSRKGPVSGVGVEGQDIVAMTDQMMRDMLQEPVFSNNPKRPRVIIDAAYFANESTQAINKNMITQRLLVNLNRAAKSKMLFINRQNAAMVEQERELKRTGTVGTGTTGLTKAPEGADYRLSGKITSLDSRSPKTGLIQRYSQISFEMTDLESGELVWTGIYEFTRAAADDVVYR